MLDIRSIIRLWNHISKRRKKQFSMLLSMMIIASFMEVISLGAILPFLGVLTNPEQLFQHNLMQPAIQTFNFTEPNQLILPITVVFISVVIISGTIRLIMLYFMTRLSYATGADLSINIYRRTLYQSYATHIERNSSEIINGIIGKTSVVISGIITPVLTLLSSIFIIIGVMAALLLIDTQVALGSFLGFGLIYLIIIRYTRKQIAKNSQCIADQSTQMIKSLQEGLGGIRDVLIDGSQKFYCKVYRNADLPLRRATGTNKFISASPRYLIETFGIILISGLAYGMSQRTGGMTTAIPILGALALGAQRLLPMLQQVYSAFTTISGSQASFKNVLELLDQPLPEYVDHDSFSLIPFDKQIVIDNLGFRYTKNTPWVLRNINIKINKGECIGFVGETGSGKSTLLDIIMGLLVSTEGVLSVDKQPITSENYHRWRLNIAHVPQNIYLSDSSIEENIAFGQPIENIDSEKVKRVADMAHISKLIDSWTDKYKTPVGENGVRLSGGQRQRIGIARALYKDSDILVLDEATSALDNETELLVMKSIEELKSNLTIFIVAHRITTLKDCDRILKIEDSGVIHDYKYDDLIKK
jgi:ATP-binding cassette subfamily B protein